jgi:hypothetical protein
VDDLVAVDELELDQSPNTLAVKRGLEGEVEAGEGLDCRQPGHSQRCLDAAVLAHRQLFGEQRVDQLERTGLAAFELA